ncbi:hypothetical protein DM860_003449 [Cuscuta australis]|uniref:Reverse transcriptase zinc-binding domain-containing protein n=1 Tax=Cuscuta australis TaxID=267555 RepID=A0A328DHM6_9ASTE|nr:hypothetical protein DM860_003449 [Cuscuta australis]
MARRRGRPKKKSTPNTGNEIQTPGSYTSIPSTSGKETPEFLMLEDELELKYIPATEVNGNLVAKLTKEDITGSSSYWDAMLICCILGANPPLEVVKGFVNRIWNSYPIEEENCRKKNDKPNTVRRKLIWRPKNKDTGEVHSEKDEAPNNEIEHGNDIEGGANETEEDFIAVTGKKAGKQKMIERTEESDWKRIAGNTKKSWGIIGDFNSVLCEKDRIGGNNVTEEETKDFRECIMACGMEEILWEGSYYTWSNKQGIGKRIFSKLDRAMANMDWIIGPGNRGRIGGNNVTEEETKDFRECIMACGMEEIPWEGSYYTWSNKQGIGKRIFSKLDRAMANMDWIIQHGNKVQVIEEGISDHCLLLLKAHNTERRNIGFKYCDMWELDNQFSNILRMIWERNNPGRYMFQVITKLKELKQPLKQLNKRFHHIHQQCDDIREELCEVQKKLKEDITNPDLIAREKECLKDLIFKNKAANLLKAQQSKHQWIVDGDQSSRLFFAWIKKRTIHNQINSILNDRGVKVEGRNKVVEVMVGKLFAKMDMKGEYETQLGYKWLMGEANAYPEFSIVWNRLTIPKHQVLMWLGWKNRISTKVRLQRFLNIVTGCVLCSNGVEDKEKWIGVQWKAKNDADLKRASESVKGRRKRQIMIAGFAVVCYAVWKARNFKIKQEKLISVEESIEWIKFQMMSFINYRLKNVVLR